ncbi:bifunctional cobalt-precorrin-7 (C(5))-methyltransferase/cobalt-precorrin-6B (C(15))-methyltransferase [Planktothricoides sp. FACHB-1370]|uniref:tRNA (guanine(46)-N(7))-methyltransferase n=3 Tax=Oscillatoriaceae TaxID=1892254 RepID=A0AAU8J928_9CYAN|nr:MULTISPECIES: bifunctional cobalt-precorrin-7 (C(5))-methyltransferase/cobalt-precorrin-6B (C(15))-methyltransferase [Planktothricoides]KOR37501.1 ATP-binding protein [Planktothricoides sp. SR001]MBD2543042.1 bifunctional cobalt-precorrin-7 (C(5))-methyltransferase/cobalt-precorrin-6B (C(15))-methyltransferase [Planktothricoides raciborskii FACHB-1370]MBD2581921.1 bifunctional cobalt-precorrin-7 (C(5))-methyltransferase/cobalt-precorrin-6B (C(15))-methyltransferase [Planktothricoides racibors
MIHVVGIGLDGVAGLTAPVRQIVEQATILVGSDRHLSYFPDHPAERLVIGSMNIINIILRKLRRRLENYLTQEITQENFGNREPGREISSVNPLSLPCIVILVSGDPLFFGLGRLLLESFPPEHLTFHPHISSIQLAFNRVKIPWQDATFISMSGRPGDELINAVKKGVEKIAILTGDRNTPSAIARLILSLDLAVSYQFWVCENLGSQEEKVQCFSDLSEIKPQTLGELGELNVVLLIRQSPEKTQPIDLNKLPQIGIPDHYFVSFRDSLRDSFASRPELITKREIRLLILGELALKPNQTIWDIGAGTGSVAIEIARLFPTSNIYAIEKSAEGIALIEQNCQRFHLSNVVSIYGSAPDILYRLAVPDRIFIGGTGGSLRQILSLCSSYMAHHGIIVLTITSIENLNIAIAWAQTSGWQYQLLQVNLYRSVPIAELTRLSPLNPVTIVTLNQK